MKTKQSSKAYWHRAGSLAIEIVVVSAAVCAGVAYCFSHPGVELNGNRIAFVLNTALIFGLLVSWFPNDRRRLLFWTTLAVLLLAHTILLLLFVKEVERIPLALYIFTNAAELTILYPTVKAVLRALSE